MKGMARGPKVPSRPGEFHPEPLTDPYVNLSIHTARVIARRLPPSAERSGSSRFNPVGPSSTAMTRPLCSAGITPLQRYYEAVRPSPAHWYFRPRGWRRLCLVWGLYCQAVSERAISLSCFLHRFLCSTWNPRFFAPTRSIAKPARAGAVKVGRRTNLSTCSALASPYLDSFEHDGTLGAVGMTIRGEPAFGRVSIAPQPCIRWVQGPEP